jgi:hypothetical protein
LGIGLLINLLAFPVVGLRLTGVEGYGNEKLPHLLQFPLCLKNRPAFVNR